MFEDKEPYCGAKVGASVGSGGICINPPGDGTTHEGEGRCSTHEGLEIFTAKTPVKRRLKQLMQKYTDSPEPMNLEPELIKLRAFLDYVMENWDRIFGEDGELHYYNMTGDKRDRPVNIPTFVDVAIMVDKVGNMVERIHKIKNTNPITLATMYSLMERLGVEIVESVKQVGIEHEMGVELLNEIQHRWGVVGKAVSEKSPVPVSINKPPALREVKNG